MGMRLSTGAPRVGQPMADTPPPLRLLQRWQPPVAAEAPVPGRWAGWGAALRRLFGR